MKKIIVIPARLSSSRLPNKVLLDLDGKTVLQRVFEQCKKVKNIDEIYIATDSEEVLSSASKYTSNIIMTDKNHQSGTDRIAEAVANLNCEIVINVQGDEPFIDPQLIENLVDSLEDQSINMASVMCKLTTVEDLKNHNIVKVTVDKNNNALYFSRSIIPYHRDGWDALLKHHQTIPDTLVFFRHLGIYGYRKHFLIEFSKMAESYLERVERLEQLRVLENGFQIRMIETKHNSIGIDTQADYEKAKSILDLLD